MIEKVHEQILEELKTNTRTDTIFVLTSIILNFVSLGINVAVASGKSTVQSTIVMFTFAALVIVINLVAEVGLIRGRQTRTKLTNGLLKMYKDNNVEGYYDPSLLENYRTRYNLFMLLVLFTGLVALVIPFIVRS